VFLNKSLYLIQFAPAEPPTTLKPDWVEPEFGRVVVTFNVNVGWFIAIASVEKEAIRANT